MEKNKDINFVFFGTPLIASQTLDILKENGYIPSLIITSPDKPSGRGLHLTKSSISIWAEKNNIPCLKPEKIDKKFIENLKLFFLPPVELSASRQSNMGLDLSIVVAYGKILPEELIKIPKLGTINIHYSLLPKYRGASPLESTILNGDENTGVSIQQMVYELDSGPILASREISIDLNESKESLKNKLINLGGELLCEIIPDLINKKISPVFQNESEATFCKKIKKEDGEINLNENPLINYNKYRAFQGWPGTYFFIKKHNKKIRVKINEASYENNLFIIKEVTPEGKKKIKYKDFLNQN